MTITGSHNSAPYNGFKLVRAGSAPISGDSGLKEIAELVEKNEFTPLKEHGKIEKLDVTEDYIEKILSFIDIKAIKPMKVVVNPNFGSGGIIVQKIADKLGIELVKLNFEPDGTFPKGRPDPMIPEIRLETSELVKSSGADMGVAWDSDADRCFWYDEKGRFVDGYYAGCVLSKIMLRKYPRAKIIHDPRLVWAAQDIIKENGGIPLVERAGHALIKERMRKEDAVFAFENSAHIYFKDYFYCDNGMIPWVIIMEEMSRTGLKLSDIVDPIRFKYPVSEEVNFKVKDPQAVIKDIEEHNKNAKLEYIDGVSVEYPEWRFNIRPSNTEPLIRLCVEAKSRDLLDRMKSEIIKDIKKDLAEI
jgi:phosphomannomutase